MSGAALFVCGLLVAAMVALTLEVLSVDLVAVLLVVLLVVTGILTPPEAFAGFASEFVFVLCAIFILSGALTRTGVMDLVGRLIYRISGSSESRAIALIMGLSSSLSAFLSNTNVTAVLLPAVLDAARKSKLSPGRLLIPLAYASMLGGAATLLGTSTNLAANGLLEQLGVEPFSVFEFLPVGLTMAVLGTVYMLLVGRRGLPAEVPASFSEQYEMRRYLAEMVVEDDADLVGQRLTDTDLRGRGLGVVAIHRGDQHVMPGAGYRLQASDVLVLKASREALLEAQDAPGLRLEATHGIADDALTGDDLKLAEAIVMPRSVLRGKTLRQLRFRDRYGLAVLAVYRRGQSYALRVSTMPLQVGDVLLLQGSSERMDLLAAGGAVWVVGDVPHLPFRQRKGLVALGALIAAIASGALGVLPLSISLLLAVVAVILAGVVSVEEVYGMIEWPLIVLIGGMTSFGVALQKTGAAAWLADQLATAFAPLGPVALMAAFAVLTMLLTQPMSNAAAALVILPVAVATAGQIGVSPRSLAVLVTLSASLSFIAPLEPACLLVYAPGKYRFRDFMVAGIPMTLIALVVLLVLVPIFWPL